MAQKSNKVEIRVTDSEKKDWQEAAGGARLVSSWLRSLANAECERLRHVKLNQHLDSSDPERLGNAIAALRVPNEKPLIVAEAAATGQCPRWMHHRPGVYCGSCKKVVKK